MHCFERISRTQVANFSLWYKFVPAFWYTFRCCFVCSERCIVSVDDCIVIDDDDDTVESMVSQTRLREIKQELSEDGVDFTKAEVQAFIKMKRAATKAAANINQVRYHFVIGQVMCEFVTLHAIPTSA